VRINGKPAPGFLFGVFMILVFGMRFIIEFIKEPQVGFEHGLYLNMGQLLSIPFVIAGITFVYLSGRRR
jgi:prolipoprotein diacylglyceryltransferase